MKASFLETCGSSRVSAWTGVECVVVVATYASSEKAGRHSESANHNTEHVGENMEWTCPRKVRRDTSWLEGALDGIQTKLVAWEEER